MAHIEIFSCLFYATHATQVLAFQLVMDANAGFLPKKRLKVPAKRAMFTATSFNADLATSVLCVLVGLGMVCSSNHSLPRRCCSIPRSRTYVRDRYERRKRR